MTKNDLPSCPDCNIQVIPSGHTPDLVECPECGDEFLIDKS